MEYNLENVQKDIEQIRTMLSTLEKQLNPELHTVKTVEKVQTLFSHITKQVELGNQIELIIRRL